MNRIEGLLENEDIEGIIEDLKKWPNVAWGNEDERWSVSPFTTFYFLYDSSRWVEVSEHMIEIHKEFERLTGYPYVVATHPDSERPHPYGTKRLPDLNSFVRKSDKDDHFMFKVTSEKKSLWSPATAGYFRKKPAYMNDDGVRRNRVYSSIQLYYKWSCWKENRTAWRSFVVDTIKKLQPEAVYSGLTMATALEFGARSSTTIWERLLASRFFGLDIDDPWSMDSLGDGLRPPTWGFLLSDIWREKLNLTREQVRDQLNDPQITVVDVSNGLWIEVGPEPSLFPVEGGIPRSLLLVNRLVKPIRDDNMDLVGFPQWDDDPNERFNDEDSRRWLSRFDETSDWPTSELRHATKPPAAMLPLQQENELRAKAGEPCPQPGRWQSIDSTEQVRRYEMGQALDALNSAYGVTVWRYLGD